MHRRASAEAAPPIRLSTDSEVAPTAAHELLRSTVDHSSGHRGTRSVEFVHENTPGCGGLSWWPTGWPNRGTCAEHPGLHVPVD